jgi:tetratricopeptide (TPR) repeat protein
VRNVCSLIALVAATGTALAEPSSAKTAAATALFDQGRALQKAGDYRGACAAFEESQRLDAALGTLYNLAGCYSHLGRLASAWAAYRAVADRDANTARRDDAEHQANDLAPRLSKLVITVNAKPLGLVVLLDNVDVTNLIGVASPVDLGIHHLEAYAAGYKPWVGDAAVIEEAKIATAPIDIVQLPAKPIPVAHHSIVVERVSRMPRRSWSALAVVTGGVLLTTGIVLAEIASSEMDNAQHLCAYDFGCTNDIAAAEQSQLMHKAEFRGDVAVGLVAAGTVLGAVGFALWLTSPPPITTRLVPGTATSPWGVTLVGRF